MVVKEDISVSSLASGDAVLFCKRLVNQFERFERLIHFQIHTTAVSKQTPGWIGGSTEARLWRRTVHRGTENCRSVFAHISPSAREPQIPAATSETHKTPIGIHLRSFHL